METTESPLDVLSRAAVMIQRNVLPPPSYDEARSLSQQQNQKLQRCKVLGLTGELDVSSSYDKAAPVPGKWKREKKYQFKTTVAASACDSTLNDYKAPIRFNGRCNSESTSEPLDMSKRSATKDRGEPPSYFQSILCSNYGRRLADVPVVIPKNDETSCTSSTSTDEKESTMCDQVINEHFRRSLGRDYVNLFAAVKPSKKNQRSEEIVSQSTVSSKAFPEVDVEAAEVIRSTSSSTLSVDDHFAKALGATWLKLQQQEKRQTKNQKGSRSVEED